MFKKTIIGGIALAIVSLATVPVQASPGTMRSTDANAMYHHQMEHQQMMQNTYMYRDGNMTGAMDANMTQMRNSDRWEYRHQYAMDDANGTMGNNLRMGLGPQYYGPFDVDVSNDPFVNPRAYMRLTGMQFVDENGDGICDIMQDTDLFRSLGIGPCMDENNDSICDRFQTREAYERLGMRNFVDVDGDGICDNYEMNPIMDDANGTMGNNLRMGLGPQHYGPFDVDVSNDPFVNPRAYMRLTGMQFMDENGDGICDIVQATDLFRSLGVGPCIDENNDTICDCFQTRNAYERLGMHNFVDVDGDGICDNYEMNPNWTSRTW